MCPVTFLSDVFVNVFNHVIVGCDPQVLYSLNSDCLMLHSDLSFYYFRGKDTTGG